MKKFKIAHILNSVGGVDVSLRLILENIDSSKFENIVIHGKDDTKTLFIDDLGNSIVDFKIPIQRNINVWKDFSSLIKTLKILKKEKPDLIHAHSAKGGVIGKIAGWILNTQVLHTPQAYSFLSVAGFKRIIYINIEKCFVRFKNNKILASSPSELYRAIHEVRYPKERVLLFNNSINIITKIESLSIPKTWPDEYICSVGRPSFQKNIEFMLDVLFELKKHKNNIHLVLMGVGFHSPNLELVNKKIDELNLRGNLSMLNWTKREDIFYIIKKSTMYISTARYEGLPYSIIESLALGKAIVATDADGNRDLVYNGINGYLIKHEDLSEFTNSILKIINDKKLNQTFSNNSLNIFLNNFEMSNNIKNLQKIYIDQINNQ